MPSGIFTGCAVDIDALRAALMSEQGGDEARRP